MRKAYVTALTAYEKTSKGYAMAMIDEYARLLQVRMARQRHFFSSGEDGTLLYGPAPENFTRFITDRLHRISVQEAVSPGRARELADEFLEAFHAGLQRVFRFDADGIPWIQVYAGIGTVTGAMTGRKVSFSGGASWCEPEMEWEEIRRLRFDPDNPWVQFAAIFCRIFLERCRGEYLLCPYIHRSPLDGANGIRGTELFAELALEPERVTSLMSWCVEWSLQMERFLAGSAGFPPGMDRAVWSTWLPPGGIFVNGDPVGMISREMQAVFEGPFTGRLFSSAGAGFFHNHSMGLYQADLVAGIPGIHVQEFIPDPDRPHTIDILLEDEEMMRRVRDAACRVPVQIDGFPAAKMEAFLRRAGRGRYILNVGGSTDESGFRELRRIAGRYPY